MIKAVLFDVDGLVLKARTQFFSHRLAAEQNIPREAVEEFFLGNFKKCSFGQADLKEEIMAYLPKWKYKGSIDDLLMYWFDSESTKDEAVLDVVSVLRKGGIACYIATRQEKYRLQYLLDDIGLKNHFDGAFCTCTIGFDKKDIRFYEHILNELALNPSEVLFLDDTPINVETAKSIGIDAHLYEGIEQLKGLAADIQK